MMAHVGGINRGQVDIFTSLVDALLPEGGYVAVLYHVYFDESGTHKGSPVMTMAGYLFEARQARLFTRDWSRDLNRLGLSHAHMTDCALGFGEYKKLSKRQRVLSEELLIKRIRKRSEVAFSISVEQDRFEKEIGETAFAHSAYTLLTLLCVMKVRDFISEKSIQTKVSYFFESGHEHANEAHLFMNAITMFGWQQYFFYSSHAFVDKRAALPLQAADMLAWQHRHYELRKREGKEQPRKDFAALARPHDLFASVEHSDVQKMKLFYEFTQQTASQNPAEWMAGVAKLFDFKA